MDISEPTRDRRVDILVLNVIRDGLATMFTF
jgi:hypothetical protein